jgi:hypothetical protein
LYSRNPLEKLNISMGKYVLGVNKRTTNLAIYGELGRYPLYIDTIISMIKYWVRLCKNTTVLNRCNWTGISTCFNMELVVTNTKTCKNVSMANISNIRNISFVSKYKLKFSLCPIKFLTFV